VGVEVGVEQGKFAESLCKAGLKLYAVDPFLIYPDYRNHLLQSVYDNFYEEAKERLKHYDCTIIKKTSMEALDDFEDESLDFVYIDGNHDFKYVAEDIVEWTKKVRKGGVVSGHDYIYIKRKSDPVRAKFVINAYMKAYEIQNWYVLGRRQKIEGEKRDKSRSWFFVVR
jgi:hypothetical protein